MGATHLQNRKIYKFVKISIRSLKFKNKRVTLKQKNQSGTINL